MKNENQNTDTKRKPGRPKGSSRYSESDNRACEKAADYLIKHAGSTTTDAFKNQGYKSESELHRVIRKFNNNRAHYLEAAQARSDFKLNLGLVGQISSYFETALDWIETVNNSAPVEFFLKEISSGKSKSLSLKKLGIGPEPPFDIKDPEKIASAIARFENREFNSTDEFIANIDEEMTTEDVPSSLKYYSMALVFHELHLQSKKNEEDEGGES